MGSTVWLDGLGLEDIHPSIHVKAIAPGAVSLKTTTMDNAKYNGLRFLTRRENERDVRITFKILDAGAENRENILTDIIGWAAGGKLEIIQRPNQYLNVVCTGYPSIENVRDYANKDLTITFTAFDPDWKAKHPTVVNTVTVAGVAKSVTIYPAGNQDITFLEVEIKNNGSGSMATAVITVNGRTFSFTGLNLTAGNTLVIRYDDTGLLTIATVGGYDRSSTRTAASDDDLILYQRMSNTVVITTSNACDVKLTARGLYR